MFGFTPQKMTIDVEDGSLRFNDMPVPDHEMRNIANKPVEYDGSNLSDFYIPETDEEREKKAPEYSAADLNEIKVRAAQALRKAPGVFAVKLPDLSDWFRNEIPKQTSMWPTGHPMSFEMASCLQPIVNSGRPVEIDWLQEQMQNRGAFMLKATESVDRKLWGLLFYLDTKFYCQVTLDSGGLPEKVAMLFDLERKQYEESLKVKDNFQDPKKRQQVLQKRQEEELLRGTTNDQEEEEMEEEDRLDKEERDAKGASFRLSGITAVVKSFRVYVIND